MEHKHKYALVSADRTVAMEFFFPRSLYYYFECTTCENVEIVIKAYFFTRVQPLMLTLWQ